MRLINGILWLMATGNILLANVANCDTIATPDITASQQGITGSKDNPTIITINLSKFEMVVSRGDKKMATFPLSYGGPSAIKCEDNSKECPTAPKHCSLESPPVGEYSVVSSEKKLESKMLASEFHDVLLFGQERFVIRSINRKSGQSPIGSAQFTCGHIVLRQADAEQLFKAVGRDGTKSFKVKVVSGNRGDS